ncbi:MAG TPA: hypothetical protein VHR55_00810 [Candidatus Limnocylindria bacterium]|nr:hypothetical protein [Candidatus Limnocylindria bacterium]
MTDQPESLQEALEDRDITLALTPGQLLVAIVAIWLLLRFIRSFRH